MSSDRTKRGLRDLILSLAVVGVFVAFLFAVPLALVALF